MCAHVIRLNVRHAHIIWCISCGPLSCRAGSTNSTASNRYEPGRIVPVTQNDGTLSKQWVTMSGDNDADLQPDITTAQQVRAYTQHAQACSRVCLHTINRTTLIRSNCACVHYYIIYCPSAIMGPLPAIDFACWRRTRCAPEALARSSTRFASATGSIDPSGWRASMISMICV